MSLQKKERQIQPTKRFFSTLRMTDKKVKTLLLFPPQWSPFIPYLSLPTLTSFLRHHGKECKQDDLNVRFYHYVLRDEILDELRPQINKLIKEYETKNYLTYEEQLRYVDLVGADVSIEKIYGQVEKAKEGLLDKKLFFDADEYYKNYLILDTFFCILSSVYTNCRMNFVSFPTYGIKSIAELKRMVEDDAFFTILKRFYREYAGEIVKYEPNIVGISVVCREQFLPAMILCREIKKHLPGSHIILGGKHIADISEDFVKQAEVFCFFDSVCISEGENTILGVVEAWEEHKQIQINNHAHRHSGIFAFFGVNSGHRGKNREHKNLELKKQQTKKSLRGEGTEKIIYPVEGCELVGEKVGADYLKNEKGTHICVPHRMQTNSATTSLLHSKDRYSQIQKIEGEFPGHKSPGYPIDLRNVEGVMFRDEMGNVVRNEVKKFPDIDKSPAPDFSGLPMELYFMAKSVIPISASRACYWRKCSFCDECSIYGPYRGRDAELIVEDIKKLKENFGTNLFSFCDESIPVNIIPAIADLGIEWYSCARTDKNLARVRVPDNCKMLMFGLETGSPRVARLINKGTNIEDTENILREVYGRGVWTHGFFFMGFPGEREKDREMTFDFIKRNQNVIDSVGIAQFVLGRWSRVDKNPEKYKIKIKKSEDIFPYIVDYDGAGKAPKKEIEKERISFTKKMPKYARVINREHLFLWLCEYKDKRYVKKLIRKIQEPKSYSEAREWKFNPDEIMQNVAMGNNTAVFASGIKKKIKVEVRYNVARFYFVG
ncbi:MAG: B12-binding domain-containing radical SAM protein [bacterium]|nr:B12-binding domain-containing radical SAM protein [bacterium]